MEEQFRAVLERLQRLEDENIQLREQIRQNEDEEARRNEAAARARVTPLVPASVDTKLINKPGEFSGKEADWPRWSLTMRAYLGAVSGRMLELVRRAENFDESIDRVDMDPGDDHLDAQLYFILTMLLKENMMEKVETVEYGEGLHLWRLMMVEFEPKFASRKMALQQAYLNFTFNKDEDPRKGIDRLETQIRQYQAATKKIVDDDTRTGVLLKALAAGSELQKKLGDHLVLNAYRVDNFIEMKREIQEYLGVKQWLAPGGSAEVLAVGKAGGKASQKGQVKGEVKIKFLGDCYFCGKPGHKKADCWWNPERKAPPGTGKGKMKEGKGKGRGKGKGKGKDSKEGEKDGKGGEDRDQGKKRPRVDVAAIEKQMRELSLSIGALRDQDCGSVELCQVSEAKEVGMVHTLTTMNHVTMGLDSGAEVTVWPPELFPQVATEESPESRRGVKYFGPGDRETPSLPNLGRRRYDLKIGDLKRSANVNVVPVRKPLLAMCSVMDAGHDLHFECGGRCYAKHTRTGEEIEIRRRGGKFEIDAEVMLPSPLHPFGGPASP